MAGRFILYFLLLNTAAFAQHKITGIITGPDGLPLFGATVSIKNTNTATSTDINGFFALSAKPGIHLLISFVGYDSREIIVGNEASLKITLQTATLSLDDVVVTGYTSQK